MTPSMDFPTTATPAPETPPPPTFAQAMRQFLSPKRLAANRRNAQFSTGPRTEQGKKNARLNAHRHGITGQVRLLPDAERRAVEAFCAPIIASFAPANGDEIQLVRNISEAQWRLNRSRAVEENIFAQHIGYRKDCTIAGDNPQIADALHMASAFSEQPEVFDRLSLYEQRIRRGMEKDRRNWTWTKINARQPKLTRWKKPSYSASTPHSTMRFSTPKAKQRRTVGWFFRLTVSTAPLFAITA